MKFTYNGHTIVVDRMVLSLILKIDGKVVDKVAGLSKILEQDAQLSGTIVNDDGSKTEVKATVENTTVAAIVKVYCDGQEVGQGILI